MSAFTEHSERLRAAAELRVNPAASSDCSSGDGCSAPLTGSAQSQSVDQTQLCSLSWRVEHHWLIDQSEWLWKALRAHWPAGQQCVCLGQSITQVSNVSRALIELLLREQIWITNTQGVERLIQTTTVNRWQQKGEEVLIDLLVFNW